jgi:hypothetical protein
MITAYKAYMETPVETPVIKYKPTPVVKGTVLVLN